MFENIELSILTPMELSEKSKRCKSSIRNDVIKGLLPPPIGTGGRKVGFYLHEIEAVMALRGLGSTTDREVRNAVKQIVASRVDVLTPKLGGISV